MATNDREPSLFDSAGLDDGRRLPWLETADEDVVERGGGGLRVLLVALIVIAAIAATGWWLLAGREGASSDADGSLIEAPEGPYKVKPEDPGGKTFDGTGDSSFVVSEGQTRGAALAPREDDVPTPTPSASNEEDAEPAPTGVGIQVGAYATRDSAEAGWATLVSRYPLLSGVNHRIVEGRADIGTVYRLQAVTGSVGAAEQLCEQLQAAGGKCQVKR